MVIGLDWRVYSTPTSRTPEFKAWRLENLSVIRQVKAMVPLNDELTRWKALITDFRPDSDRIAEVGTTPARHEWLYELRGMEDLAA